MKITVGREFENEIEYEEFLAHIRDIKRAAEAYQEFHQWLRNIYKYQDTDKLDVSDTYDKLNDFYSEVE